MNLSIAVLLLFIVVKVSALPFNFMTGMANEDSTSTRMSLYICRNDLQQCANNNTRHYPLVSHTLYATEECISAGADSCQKLFFPSDHAVFILRAEIEVQRLKLAQLAISGFSVFPIDSNFVLVDMLESQLEQFEQMATKLEKQKINFTARQKNGSKRTNKLNLKDRQTIKNDDEKDDIINSMSVTEYATNLQKLTGVQSFTVDSGTYTIQTRHSSTASNAHAAEFIYEYLEDLGYDTYYENFRCQSGYTTQNIIGVKHATGPVSDEVVVVGGHMDSTSPNTNNAPGAVDNGSGADGMMLIAKAFQYVSLARTVFFMGFGCEEQGLIGSEYFCDNTDENVVAAITMDMIAYSNDYYGVMIEGLPDPDIQNLMRLMEDNCETYSPRLNTTSRNFSFGSDHVSFQNADIPAFLAIEQDETDYNCYHATCDTYSQCNTNMATDIAKGCAGVLYDIAKAA